MATTAARLNASGDYLRRTSGLLDYNSAYTVLFWFYSATDRGVGYQAIFTQSADGSKYDEFYLNASGNFAIEVSNSSATTTTGSAPTGATWTHIALVRESATSLKLYVDGSATADITNTRSVSGRTANANMSFGTNAFSEWADFRVAFARIYASALSNAEINAEMDATAAVLAGEWGDWPFQADPNDDSGNARDWTEGGSITYSEAGPDIASGTTYNQSAGGTLTTAGALVKRGNKVVSGTLTTAGALVKRAGKVVAGTLTSAGTLATSRLYSQVVEGTLTTAGTLVRQTNKAVAGALTTAGALVRMVGKVVAGALTTAGALVADFISGSATFTQAVGGTLTTAGTLAKRTSKSVAGALTTAGSISKAISKLVGGTLTTAGALVREWFSPSAAKVDVTLTDARIYTCTPTDARAYTCTVADALTYSVSLGDSTT